MHGVDKIYDLHLEFSQNFISGKRLWGSRRKFEIDISDLNLKKIYDDEIKKKSEKKIEKISEIKKMSEEEKKKIFDEEKFKFQLFKQAQSQMHLIKANYDGS
jgi:hypothetical protein